MSYSSLDEQLISHGSDPGKVRVELKAYLSLPKKTDVTQVATVQHVQIIKNPEQRKIFAWRSHILGMPLSIGSITDFLFVL